MKKRIFIIIVTLGILLSVGISLAWAKPLYDSPLASNFGTIYPDGTDSKIAADSATFYLKTIGYNANTLTEINNNKYIAEDLIREDAIFSFTGHAAPGVLVFHDGSEKSYFFANSDLKKLSQLKDLLFSVYIGCNTAQTDGTYGSLLETSKNEGVDSALGFNDSIYIEHTNYWAERFWYWATKIGNTLREATSKACEDVRIQFGDYGNTDSFKFDGDSYDPALIEINPARYGDWKYKNKSLANLIHNNTESYSNIPKSLLDKAIKCVREFTSKPDLNVEQFRIEKSLTNKDYIVLITDGIEYKVDNSIQKVVSIYSKKAESKNTKEIKFNIDEAYDIAQNFVFDKIKNFSNMKMELVKKELQDHGCYAEYLFEWRSMSSPSFVSVIVGPTTGEIVSYNFWLDETKIAPYSKIKRDKAIEIAKNLVDFKVNKVKKSDLQVWYDNESNPVLLWIIELEGEPKEIELEGKNIGISQGALIVIDANTSEVIRVYKTL